jgi:hypothetical protein
MNGNGTRNPDTILAEIEHTRSQMDSTLDAIERRLTPGELIDQGLNYLRNSGGREFVSNLGTSLKENPLAASLAGVGLAWLMATQQGSRSTARSSVQADAGDSPASDLFDRAADSAAAAKEKVAGALETAREGLNSTGQRARNAWSKTTETTRDQLDRARDQYRHVLEGQPLALGVVGLGIGALLAALAPRTRQEDELMGKTAEALKENLAVAGRDQLQNIGEKVVGAVHEQGGAPGSGASNGEPRGGRSST